MNHPHIILVNVSATRQLMACSMPERRILSAITMDGDTCLRILTCIHRKIFTSRSVIKLTLKPIRGLPTTYGLSARKCTNPAILAMPRLRSSWRRSRISAQIGRTRESINIRVDIRGSLSNGTSRNWVCSTLCTLMGREGMFDEYSILNLLYRTNCPSATMCSDCAHFRESHLFRVCVQLENFKFFVQKWH